MSRRRTSLRPIAVSLVLIAIAAVTVTANFGGGWAIESIFGTNATNVTDKAQVHRGRRSMSVIGSRRL